MEKLLEHGSEPFSVTKRTLIRLLTESPAIAQLIQDNYCSIDQIEAIIKLATNHYENSQHQQAYNNSEYQSTRAHHVCESIKDTLSNTDILSLISNKNISVDFLIQNWSKAPLIKQLSLIIQSGHLPIDTIPQNKLLLKLYSNENFRNLVIKKSYSFEQIQALCSITKDKDKQTRQIALLIQYF